MHGHLRHAGALRQLEHGEDVRLMTVNAARREQAHHVQGTAIGLHDGAGGIQFGIGKKTAILDRGIDAGQVLVDDAAGAEVHVANFRVAHLPIRQSNETAFGVDQGVRAGRQQLPPVRQVGQRQRVVGSLFTMSPAIQDQQHDGLGTHRPALGHGNS